jgi:hypothetical protein
VCDIHAHTEMLNARDICINKEQIRRHLESVFRMVWGTLHHLIVIKLVTIFHPKISIYITISEVWNQRSCMGAAILSPGPGAESKRTFSQRGVRMSHPKTALIQWGLGMTHLIVVKFFLKILIWFFKLFCRKFQWLQIFQLVSTALKF